MSDGPCPDGWGFFVARELEVKLYCAQDIKVLTVVGIGDIMCLGLSHGGFRHFLRKGVMP